MILNIKKGSLILLSGIPGSGKTTFCNKYFQDKKDYVISSDELRQRYFGIKNMFSDDGELFLSLYQGTGKEVFEIMEKLAKKRCELGLTTVIDSTNLSDKDRKSFIKLGKWNEIITIIFDEKIGIERNKQRKINKEIGYVNESVIKRMLEKFDKKTSIKGNKTIKAEEIEEINEIFDEIEITNQRNILIYGDVHGIKDFYNNYKLLQEKYTKNGVKPLSIFLGDIVDRGEYSLDNLLFVMLETFRQNAIMINGNHDKKLLENIRYYKENSDINEIVVSRFTTIKRFVDYFRNNKKDLMIDEIKDRNFSLEMIEDFLENNNYYKILKYKNSKYLLTHAPILFEENFGNILKQEGMHSCYQFLNDIKSSKEESKNNKINFLKAFGVLYKDTNTKLVCGHFDLSQIQEEYNIGNGLISLEGKVDEGGFLKVLSISVNENGIIEEEIHKFESNLNYKRDDLVGETFNEIKNLDRKYYFKKDFGNLSLFKYSKEVFYDNLWMKNEENINKLLLKLRGLVLDINGNVVSYPFDKIFNLGEVLKDSNNNITQENKLIDEKEYEFVEKLNGFLGIISPNPYNDELLIHTGGSFGGEYVDLIKDFLSEEKTKNLKNYFKENKQTLCFEVIHEKDPHIIEYNQDEFGLYLIGARNISSGNIENMELLKEEELDKLAEKLNFKRPKYFTKKYSEIKNEIKNLKIEGYIVRDLGGEPILKLKTHYYLITKFLSRMGNGKFELLFKNKEQFIKTKQVDEEYFPVLDYIIENKEIFSLKDNLEKADFIRDFLER